MTVENISRSISMKECCQPRRASNPRPPGLQSDAHPSHAVGKCMYIPLCEVGNIWVSQVEMYLSVKCRQWRPDQTAWICSLIRAFTVLKQNYWILFFFDLGFTALSRIFHLYRADRSSKVGENRRTQRKTTWPSVSRTWLSHIWPERGSNHSGEKPNGLRVNSLIH